MPVTDSRGLSLTPGDTVLVPCTIYSITQTASSTTFNLQTLATMPGNGVSISINQIDSSMLLRANPADLPVSFGLKTAGPTSNLSAVLS